MSRDPIASSGRGMSRRRLLAAGATGMVGSLAGCVRDVRNVVNRDPIDQLSLSITTLPADGDRESIQLTRRLAENLEAVGIDVSIDLRSNEEFLRAILVNHDFDVYVGRHPGATDPDFLYEALHSRYADESGWQNPFGVTNIGLDDLLEAQRVADGDERQDAVAALLEELAREQPFVPVCVPDEHRLVRTDRFEGWEDHHLDTRLGYLGLEPQTEAAEKRLRATVMDARPSENVNPLSAEYRDRGTITELLYDSLATELVPGTESADSGGDDEPGTETDLPRSDEESELVPWLAESWEWDDSTVEITLREDCQFHDGEPVTAGDVAFTYRFLADTSLGESDVPSPSPRYRGLAAAIDDLEDDIDVPDDGGRTLSLTVATNRAVAERAFTAPILPEHVWRERAAAANVRGVQVAQGTTEAVVTDNVPAVGSGPFAFERRTEREHLTLERFDDHFTRRSDVDLPEATVEELRFQIDPRSTSAITLVTDDDADVTSTPLEMYALEEIPDSEQTRLLESPSQAFYHVGFNTRRAPFSNPYFRRTVARLLDKAWLAETIFEGRAIPVATPLETSVGREWVPEELRWNDSDPTVPFFGAGGELDVDDAKREFEAIGYRYGEGGDLLVRR